MRQIIVSNWVSLDGFISGPNGEIDWFSWSEEIAEFHREFQENIDTLIFGRKTYEIMADYWPTDKADNEKPSTIRHMNQSDKIVYSTTLDHSDWNNTTIRKTIDAADIKAMKQAPGKDIVIYGSGSIVTALANLQLIDRYYIMVNPILLGSGTPFAPALTHFAKLERLLVKPFEAGGVMIQYAAGNQ